MSYQEIIKKVLQDANDWVPSWKLTCINTPYGWIGKSGDRRARELAEADEIEHKIEGKYAYYRTKQPKAYEIYFVEGKEVLRVPIF